MTLALSEPVLRLENENAFDSEYIYLGGGWHAVVKYASGDPPSTLLRQLPELCS
jgi:hypothetical protein